jgi:hypothetical protein
MKRITTVLRESEAMAVRAVRYMGRPMMDTC